MDLHNILNLVATALNVALFLKNMEYSKYIAEQRVKVLDVIQNLSTIACKLDTKIDGVIEKSIQSDSDK